jgi:16S rRNA C967 or C1407 C5-methylase (RsmB/RsmF family)
MKRERWARVAAGWEKYADQVRRQTMPVSMWMVDAIAPQPGHTVLDLAAGIGDTGFLAAELIEPGGTLITSDYLPEMLSAAQRRATALGVRNARFKQIDASVPIDIEAATPRTRCRRHAACCGRAVAWRSPRGPAPTTTRGARCRSACCSSAA